MTNPDILIVGAGHNGLVAAAYLAKAGKDVAAARTILQSLPPAQRKQGQRGATR